jgi:hypothetical protein
VPRGGIKRTTERVIATLAAAHLRYARVWPWLNWTLFVVGLAFVTAVLTGIVEYSGNVPVLEDGRNYWEGLAYADPHYRYSPAFLWATAPLRAVPFEVFAVIWTGMHVATVAWLGPWMLAMPGVADDVIAGNINVFLAVALVVKWWPVILLTKVTPGVGIVYHLVRREWQMLAGAAGVTLGLVVVGYLLDPTIWVGWIDSLRAGTENYATVDVLAPLPVRVAAGILLCALSARWLWLLPVGMVVAMPGLWPSSFALLAAIPRLRRTTSPRPVARESMPGAAEL